MVVDFGCGGGIDVILAAQLVGSGGKVVGLDFAAQMIERAKTAITKAGLLDSGIELIVANLGDSQLPSNFSDVVISNCVINLCPDKDAVYEDAYRILKPGGHIAISDVILIDDIAPQLRSRFQTTWAGCLGGAILDEDYWQVVLKAGFVEIQVISQHTLTPEELTAMASCPGSEFTPSPSSKDLSSVQGKVSSIKFTAYKPD
ncbi:MAG: methyltransferase domain-containing protein [Deltaproteobacteria bacterium]|nr:methyltransferase domain-containing protein [Deltaproteobacteria bacterium]